MLSSTNEYKEIICYNTVLRPFTVVLCRQGIHKEECLILAKYFELCVIIV